MVIYWIFKLSHNDNYVNFYSCEHKNRTPLPGWGWYFFGAHFPQVTLEINLPFTAHRMHEKIFVLNLLPSEAFRAARLTWLLFCHTSKACTPNPLLSIAMVDAPGAIQVCLHPDRLKTVIPPLLHGKVLLHLGWRKIRRTGSGSTNSSRRPAIAPVARPMSSFLPVLSRSTGWWSTLPPGASFLTMSSWSRGDGLRPCPPLFPISCCTNRYRSCVQRTIRRGVPRFWIT